VEQRENESAWRQLLVQGVLAVLLPTEDLENGCLRTLVAEIFAEMILGNGISGKACEGWLLWEGITRVAEVLQDGAKEKDPQSGDESNEQSLSRLERFGLLPQPTDEQSGSTESLLSNRRHESAPMTISTVFWMVVQYAFLASTAMRAVIVGVAISFSLPPRSVTGASGQSPVEGGRQSKLPQPDYPALRRTLASKQPIVSMKLWSCASRLVGLNSRMPWLSGLISMLHWGVLSGPGRVGDTEGVLDRYVTILFSSFSWLASALKPPFSATLCPSAAERPAWTFDHLTWPPANATARRLLASPCQCALTPASHGTRSRAAS
jgi:hypothetical protein